MNLDLTDVINAAIADYAQMALIIVSGCAVFWGTCVAISMLQKTSGPGASGKKYYSRKKAIPIFDTVSKFCSTKKK